MVGQGEMVDPFIGGGEQDAMAGFAGSDGEADGQVGFAGAGRDSDRLQHLRRLLPCEVRVTSSVHPLFGRLLLASGFKRHGGVLFLVVLLPDGSPGTIPVAATDILGSEPVGGVVTALSVEGIRELRGLVGSLRRSRRSSAGAGTRK